MFRGLLRKANADGLTVDTRVQGEHWLVELQRRDDLGVPVSGIDWESASTNEIGKQNEVIIREVGLGRYTAKIPLADVERVDLRVHDRDFDKLKVLHWRRPYPAEYSLAAEPPQVIGQLQEFTVESVRDDMTQVPQRKPMAHYAYFAALASLLTGLILRRV